MTNLIFLNSPLKTTADVNIIAWRDDVLTREDLEAAVIRTIEDLQQAGIKGGDPVLLKADYAPQTVAVLLALIEMNAIIIPMIPATANRAPELVDLVDPAWIISIDEQQAMTVDVRKILNSNDFYRKLKNTDCPGLILFTSGSTGEPKVVVHDFSKLLAKFTKPRPPMSTINFLMFDHWGGLNTLLHCLATGSLVVLPENRQPDYICKLIEQHKIELLPSTPTFLNMLLISRAYQEHDLSSLRFISYGAEPMPESTLKGLQRVFPKAEFRQTYGMIELGVLRAQSKSSDSLWVRLGGEGYDLRVVNGILQIKADAAMMGYLNAPSPITEDGYFITGDRVEVDGDYMRILGRESELINVGGQKVYPAEVEAVLLEHDDVMDAVVYGADSPISGKVVCATIQNNDGIDPVKARQDIKRFCSKKLEPFKIPVKIRFASAPLHGDRQKRMRRQPQD